MTTVVIGMIRSVTTDCGERILKIATLGYLIYHNVEIYKVSQKERHSNSVPKLSHTLSKFTLKLDVMHNDENRVRFA